MLTIPFSINDAYEGLADVDGLVRLEADRLTLEFQTKDAFFGVVKSDLKRVEITLGDLTAVTFKKKMFWATLALRVCTMALIEAVPGAKRGEIKLRFARKHRDEAQTLASSLNLRLSEHRLTQMDDEMLPLAGHPHPDQPDDL